MSVKICENLTWKLREVLTLFPFSATLNLRFVVTVYFVLLRIARK